MAASSARRPPRACLFTPLLSLIPGLAQLVYGRTVRGLLLFVLGTGSANLAALSVVAPVEGLGRDTATIGAGIAAATIVFAICDAYWLGFWLRRRDLYERRRDLLRQGAEHLRGRRNSRARAAVQEAISIDGHDASAHAWLAAIDRRAGRFDSAIRHARIALKRSRSSMERARNRRKLERAREALRGR